MNPKEREVVEAEAEELAAANARVGSILGLCPDCAESHEHAAWCSRKDFELAPRPTPVTYLRVKATGGQRRVHMRRSDRDAWLCGLTAPAVVVGELVEVTCKGCRIARGLPFKRRRA